MGWSVSNGETFGRLTVIDLAYSARRRNGKAGERIMLCRCECGNKVDVKTSNLKSGNTKSCGCYKSDMTIQSNIKRVDNNVEDINSNMAYVCECGSTKWALLKSKWFECHNCGFQLPPARRVDIKEIPSHLKHIFDE